MRSVFVLLFFLIGLNVYALNIHTEPKKIPVLSIRDIIKVKELKKFKFILQIIPSFTGDLFSKIQVELKFNELPPLDAY